VARVTGSGVTSDSWPVSPWRKRATEGGITAGSTRIPKAELTGIHGRLVKQMSRRMVGDVPEGVGVMWHNRKVLNFSPDAVATWD
jgi:hypothetical protein